ncbi:hypothetical protein OHB05_39090 [Streptomyces sp. NBC_00638]|uniref:hypothetical protein n=1 Tax=unclassified Streptomyces TaxID=2593676 RepID=UPI00224D7DC6|nr:hypothetical protein [Streptomyces sp. NBC_00638]MCX5008562.1 hypothetical protein [Streptomyces sp. NBC_00638]
MNGNRAIAMAGVAGVSVLVLAGCGSDSDAEDQPFAGKSADQIAAEAVKATRQAESMHVSGTVRQTAGEALEVDLSVDQRKNCEGTVKTAGTTAEVRHVDATLYLRGDEGYWRNALKGQPRRDTLVPKLKDKWAKVPTDDSTTEGLCDKQGLVASMDEDKSERQGLKKASTTTVGGKKAIRLTKKAAGGEVLTLFVATEGKPYILRTTTSGGKGPNTATFSDYNKAVNPQKPSAGETVDLQDIASSAQAG